MGEVVEHVQIKNKADVMKCMGKQVYWDDIGSRWIFLRTGILEEYTRRQVCIDGNWYMMNRLSGLRNYSGIKK